MLTFDGTSWFWNLTLSLCPVLRRVLTLVVVEGAGHCGSVT